MFWLTDNNGRQQGNMLSKENKSCSDCKFFLALPEGSLILISVQTPGFSLSFHSLPWLGYLPCVSP